MHDTTLQVIDIRALDVEEGQEYVTIAMMTGIQTPFAGPDGQPVTLPTGIYKVPVSKQAAQQLLDGLQAQVENLPDPRPQSNIFVPGSNDDVDRLANDLNRFK